MRILSTDINLTYKNVYLSKTSQHLKKITLCQVREKIADSLLTDENCKLLAFPYLFSTGKCGCNVQHDIKLSPATYSSKLCPAICI